MKSWGASLSLHRQHPCETTETADHMHLQRSVRPLFMRAEGVRRLHPCSYATSLRPLRPFARIIRFRKPQAQFLVKRLRDICERETLLADLRVLTGLVEMTSGDVRSCLNTLQVSWPFVTPS